MRLRCARRREDAGSQRHAREIGRRRAVVDPLQHAAGRRDDDPDVAVHCEGDGVLGPDADAQRRGEVAVDPGGMHPGTSDWIVRASWLGLSASSPRPATLSRTACSTCGLSARVGTADDDAAHGEQARVAELAVAEGRARAERDERTDGEREQAQPGAATAGDDATETGGHVASVRRAARASSLRDGDGAEQLDLVLELDAVLLAHAPATLADQRGDVRRGRAADVLDEVRVHG